MEPRCSRCAAPIEKQAKGYKRKSLLSITDLRSAQQLFPDLHPPGAFLCFSCVRLVYQRTRKCGKKRVYVDPRPPPRPVASARPSSTVTEHAQPPKKLKQRLKTAPNEHDYASQDPEPAPRTDPTPSRRPRRGPIPQICGFLQKKKLSSALNLLLGVSGFQEVLIKTCSRLICKERKAMVGDLEGPYRKPLGACHLSAFSWDKTTSWAKEKAPLTVACLRAMFPPAKKIQKQMVNHGRRTKSRQLTEEEVTQLLDRRVSLLLAVPLYTSSLRACFLQSAFSVEMLRHRCPVKLFNIMNSLGLSQCKTAARVHAKRLAAEHRRQVQQWRDEIQTSRRTQYRCEESRKAAAFSFSWGKVRVPSPSRSDAADRGYSFETWAFRFAHRARVNFRYLHGGSMKAMEVSPYSVLPSRQTYESLRQRMKTIVMRIIADNLKALKGPRGRVERHIPHVHSNLMKEASTTVSLGAVVPSTAQRSVSAAYGLKDYIPELSGKPFHILCCGDVLTCDKSDATKIHDNQTAHADGELEFDGLIEAPQEFQKEHLFHEEMMKMLLSEKSQMSRGSLHHIKSLFHFKTFNNTAKDYFLNIWDFITFVTTAFVTLFAVTECGLDSVEQRPPGYPSQVSDQMDWLSGLAHRLLDLVWMPPPQEDINTAAAAAAGHQDAQKKIFPFCYCKEEKPGEKLLRCCSNLCAGIWFHEGCARARTQSDLQEDWFCSPDCGADGTYVYCHCKEQRGGQMVQCGLMEQCRRHEWYHRDCLTGVEQTGAEQTPWFCSEACSLVTDGQDFLLNYTKAVVWEGLYHMARRDAIQEGDGDAMTDFWRTDLVLLWTREHLRLFNSGHQLLTGLGGFYPERLRHELKWNRVLNLEGRAGGNLSLDLVTEVMISEFKGVIEFGKGSFTPQQVEQSAQLTGAQATDLDRLFFTGGVPLNVSTYVSRLTSTCRRKEDVSRFVDEFRKDELFAFKPGRQHDGFAGFTYQQRVKWPRRMGGAMRALCEDLDRHRDRLL